VSDHVYRITEVVGSSTDSVQAAIEAGLARVTRTVRNVEWFEATQIRGGQGRRDRGYQVCCRGFPPRGLR
jgi:flavin-binding protein dodecin